MNALATGLVVLVAISAWISVFVVIPSCARSLFRYRLWRLRDTMVDDLRHEQYSDEHEPRLLLDEIELSIEFARDLSLFRVALLRVTARQAAESVDPPEWFDLEKAPANDRELLGERAGELLFAQQKHVLLGSPSGWLFLVALLPLALLITVIQMSPHLVFREAFREAKSRVRDGVPDPEPALALLGAKGERRRRPLSTYA